MSLCSRAQIHFLCDLPLLALVALMPAMAQSQGASAAGKAADSDGAPAVIPNRNAGATAANAEPEKQDKRVFGVFPNYRTADGNVVFQPITSKQKFLIGLKDSFDWPVYPVAATFAALYQLEDENPSFGQGMKGYARRFGTALSDQVIGNVMTESLFPSLLHEDPRYFRIGSSRGGWAHRVAYAASRTLITRTDSGGKSFNFSEVLGNATAVAISNAYYPDTRTLSENIERLGIALATDTFSQVMKEFWPDVKRKLFHRHDNHTQALPGMP